MNTATAPRWLSVPSTSAEKPVDSANSRCTICRLHIAVVVYFNVPVCSGCRAFFRRSVKRRDRPYVCLNGRLCGRELLVPNRRVCKHCRFQRCVDAGMLAAKVRLESRLMESARSFARMDESPSRRSDDSTESSATSPSTSESAQPMGRIASPLGGAASADVLSRFAALRRRIAAQRPGGGGESPGIGHDIAAGCAETLAFRRLAPRDSLFDGLSPEEWGFVADGGGAALWWSLGEQLRHTAANWDGAERKLWNTDGSWSRLDADALRRHWSAVAAQTASGVVFDATIDYVGRVQCDVLDTVARKLRRSRLDDAEYAALQLLLISAVCYSDSTSASARQWLSELRTATLRDLNAHIAATGRSAVEERVADVVFLVADFQQLGRLVKHATRLVAVATDCRCIPANFIELLGDAFTSAEIN